MKPHISMEQFKDYGNTFEKSRASANFVENNYKNYIPVPQTIINNFNF